MRTPRADPRADPKARYRADLSTDDLVKELGTLRRRRLAIERLICRYLADLADRTGQDPGGPFGAGYTDAFQIAEEIFGFGTRPTRERIRVGRALRKLPRIEEALEKGEISFTRVREITRVARPESEATWLEIGGTLPIRELQKRVGDSGARSKERRAPRSASLSPLDDASVRMVLDLPMNDWIQLQKILQTIRDRAPRVLTDAEAVMALAGEVAVSVNRSDDVQYDTEHGPVRAGGAQIAYGAEQANGGQIARGIEQTSGAQVPQDVEHAGGGQIARRTAATCNAGGAKGIAPDDPAGSPRAARTADSPLDPAGSSHSPVATTSAAMDEHRDSALVYEDPTLRDAARLLQHLPLRPWWSVDDLCEATNLGVGALLAALLELELQGTIRRSLTGFCCMRDAA